MLQRRVFINKIMMLQRTQMLQRTRKNTIGRRRKRVHMNCRAFTLWVERQSSFLLSFVRFSYQFRSVICLFAPCLCFFSDLNVVCISVKLILYYFYTYTFFLILYYISPDSVVVFEGNFALGCGPGRDYS